MKFKGSEEYNFFKLIFKALLPYRDSEMNGFVGTGEKSSVES